jgi:hypothetical protein
VRDALRVEDDDRSMKGGCREDDTEHEKRRRTWKARMRR